MDFAVVLADEVLFLLGMCRIDFLISVWFLKKYSDSVRNEFGSVRLKNAVWFGY